MQTFKIFVWIETNTKTIHEKLDNDLLCDGFSTNDVDKCVYTKYKNGECVTICLYMDTMLIFGTCIDSF